MVQSLLTCVGLELKDIDLLAVSAGPGSFTGVRIGVSCVIGMAMPEQKSCVGVSTLEAMAENLSQEENAVICAVMDARCHQAYQAFFSAENGKLSRLTEDRALSIEELIKDCENIEKKVILVGDGAKLCYNTMGFQEIGVKIAPEHLLYQRASGVAAAALRAAKLGKTVSPSQLTPFYLRLPQAERELRKRQGLL